MTSEKNDIQARKVTEKVSDTLSGFTSIFSGPISAVKDLARPAYWIPDEDILRCAWQYSLGYFFTRKENPSFSVATSVEETSHLLRQYPPLLLLLLLLRPHPPSRPSRSITAGSAETACATRAPKPTCRCPIAAGTAQCAFATSAWKRPSMMQLPPSTQLSQCICSTISGPMGLSLVLNHLQGDP